MALAPGSRARTSAVGKFPRDHTVMRCAPLVKSLTVSARLFPSQFKKKKKKYGLLRVENPVNTYEKAS